LEGNFFGCVHDGAQEFSDIQGQELLVIFENFMHQECGNLVLVNIAHENIQVIVNLKLVLEVLANVGNEEPVSLLDKFNVVLIVVGLSVYSLLNDLQGNRCHIERLEQSLVLLIGARWILFKVKK
jgi:hypothetical protein